MDDSSSSQQAKCPCGFWGSANTHGLCSRCYKEELEKSSLPIDSTNPLTNSQQKGSKPELLRTGNSNLKVITNSTTTRTTSVSSNCNFSSIDPHLRRQTTDITANNSSTLTATTPSLYEIPAHVMSQLQLTATDCQQIPSLVAFDSNNSADSSKQSDDKNDKSDKKLGDTKLDKSLDNKEETNNEETVDNTKSPDTQVKSEVEPAASSSHNPNEHGERRGVKRSHEEDPESSPASSKCTQKNKKRCYKCSVKLNIAQRSIGRCKCDFIFCTVHRMPEQHDCDFDHKEDGRRDAKKKMVKPRRHIGTNCKRIDSNDKH